MSQPNDMRPHIEILAPAGGWDSVSAAVRSGANAVYLGFGALNARRNAKGFTQEEFVEAVGYCHRRDVKVHLTLNTLVFDRELESAADMVRMAAQTGVDAIIVQDMAVAHLVKEICPSMPIHGSTQMSVNSVNGARMLEELGFARVVLARELSRAELEEIIAHTEVETEVFVHGAHCMSVSGQCSMSAMIGQRSGNRGLCAQPCRLPFGEAGRNQYNLSLKDLTLIPHLTQLAAIGVTSVKIEGRMKRPEYVAGAVAACRAALDGQPMGPHMERLEKVFSRSGFTDGFYAGQLGGRMYGVRQREDVVAAKEVLGELEQLYNREKPLVPITFTYLQRAGQPVGLTIEDDRGNRFTATSGLPEPAENKPISRERVEAQLNKLGGTPYYIMDCIFEMDEGLMVPVSAINQLRRTCVEQLDQARAMGFEKPVQPCALTLPEIISSSGEKPELRGRFYNLDQIPPDAVDAFSMLYLPIRQALRMNGSIPKERVILEPPRVQFGQEAQVFQDLQRAKEMGFSHLCIMNIGDFAAARQLGMTPHGGFGLNIFNSAALEQYRKLGLADSELSIELDLARSGRLSGLPKGLIAYGYLPLMLVRNCPGHGLEKEGLYCSSCPGHLEMEDRLGNRFRLRCNEYKTATEIYNCNPLYLADRLHELADLDFLTLHFTFETAEEVREVVDAYRLGGAKWEGITRGLVYRPVK